MDLAHLILLHLVRHCILGSTTLDMSLGVADDGALGVALGVAHGTYNGSILASVTTQLKEFRRISSFMY